MLIPALSLSKKSDPSIILYLVFVLKTKAFISSTWRLLLNSGSHIFCKVTTSEALSVPFMALIPAFFCSFFGLAAVGMHDLCVSVRVDSVSNKTR